MNEKMAAIIGETSTMKIDTDKLFALKGSRAATDAKIGETTTILLTPSA